MSVTVMSLHRLPIKPEFRSHRQSGPQRVRQLVNVRKVAASLRREPELIQAYLSYELSENCVMDDVSGKVALCIPGNYTDGFITENLEGFVDVFVLCSKCLSLRTSLVVDEAKKRKFLSIECEICGAMTRVNHGIDKYVIARLLEIQQEKEDKISKLKEKRRLKREADASDKDASSNPDAVIKEGTDESKALQRETKLNQAVQQLASLLAHDDVADFVALDVAYELLADNELPAQDLVALVWNATFRGSRNVRLVMQIYASLYRTIVEALAVYDAPLLVLGCVEIFVALDLDKSAEAVLQSVRSAPEIFQVLIESRVLKSQTIIDWFDGKTQSVYPSKWSNEGSLRVEQQQARLAEMKKACSELVEAIRRQFDEPEETTASEYVAVVDKTPLVESPRVAPREDDPEDWVILE